MNPATSPAKRVMQTVRCCEILYMRWRFVGKGFPGTHHKMCVKCDAWLDYKSSTPDGRAKRDRDRMQDRAARFLQQGLTTNGKIRQRSAPLISYSQIGGSYELELIKRKKQHIRERVLKNYHVRTARLAKQGLNSRGKTPRRAIRFFKRTDQDKAWEQFRSEIKVGITAVEDYWTTKTQEFMQ